MRYLVGGALMLAVSAVVILLCGFAADPEDPVNELDGIPPLIRRHASIAEDLAFDESEVGS